MDTSGSDGGGTGAAVADSGGREVDLWLPDTASGTRLGELCIAGSQSETTSNSVGFPSEISSEIL